MQALLPKICDIYRDVFRFQAFDSWKMGWKI